MIARMLAWWRSFRCRYDFHGERDAIEFRKGVRPRRTCFTCRFCKNEFRK